MILHIIITLHLRCIIQRYQIQQSCLVQEQGVLSGVLMFLLLGQQNFQWCPAGVKRIGWIPTTIIQNNELRALHIYYKEYKIKTHITKNKDYWNFFQNSGLFFFTDFIPFSRFLSRDLISLSIDPTCFASSIFFLSLSINCLRRFFSLSVFYHMSLVSSLVFL